MAIFKFKYVAPPMSTCMGGTCMGTCYGACQWGLLRAIQVGHTAMVGTA